ncbi:hypothetical protein U8335_27570 [Roseiconus lacunae]|uniref:hypothetical protein n=1 Tax=Roseiconus lacunae TaxID=2605694 RepID=UPI0030928A57|nr:hypothetical protein U8335_27570 [Stieleria sp. HD01]
MPRRLVWRYRGGIVKDANGFPTARLSPPDPIAQRIRQPRIRQPKPLTVAITPTEDSLFIPRVSGRLALGLGRTSVTGSLGNCLAAAFWVRGVIIGWR